MKNNLGIFLIIGSIVLLPTVFAEDTITKATRDSIQIVSTVTTTRICPASQLVKQKDFLKSEIESLEVRRIALQKELDLVDFKLRRASELGVTVPTMIIGGIVADPAIEP